MPGRNVHARHAVGEIRHLARADAVQFVEVDSREPRPGRGHHSTRWWVRSVRARSRGAHALSQEEEHLRLFDRVDFEAWNGPDWDLFRELHTDDVIVEMSGQRTEGIEAHVAMCQAMIAANGDSKVRSHPIAFGSGEWTCAVGELGGGYQMVTLAKWRDNKICEEYLFMGGAPDATGAANH